MSLYILSDTLLLVMLIILSVLLLVLADIQQFRVPHFDIKREFVYKKVLSILNERNILSKLRSTSKDSYGEIYSLRFELREVLDSNKDLIMNAYNKLEIMKNCNFDDEYEDLKRVLKDVKSYY